MSISTLYKMLWYTTRYVITQLSNSIRVQQMQREYS